MSELTWSRDAFSGRLSFASVGAWAEPSGRQLSVFDQAAAISRRQDTRCYRFSRRREKVDCLLHIIDRLAQVPLFIQLVLLDEQRLHNASRYSSGRVSYG